MEPAVHLRGAVSLIGRFPALAGVDLDVDRSEVVLLQGPNGAGKTTILRCCAGLVPVSAGEAQVLGIDLTRDRRSVRRRVGLLGHATGLYDELTVADNVGFWTRSAGADQGDAEAAMATRIERASRDVAVGQLSAGQRRRTALAVMVARRAELWLLDEPHAGLDHEGATIDGLIAEASAAGVTVLIASHERERAEAVVHRTVAVGGGTVRPAPAAPKVGAADVP